MNIVELFGIPIGYHKLTTLNSEEAFEYVQKQEFKISDDTGHQATKNERLLQDDYFKEVKEEVKEATFRYAKDTHGHKIDNVGITGSWANITENQGEIEAHTHSNSYISGVFYLTNGSTINFYNPKPTIELFMVRPGVEFNPENRYTWSTNTITPEPNLMLIFPSMMPHSVTPSLERRCSIAYNTMPTGTFGDETTLLSIRDVDYTP